MNMASIGLGSIAATTTVAVTTMVTIPATGTTPPSTVGHIVRGAHQCTGAWELVAGAGLERRGSAFTADISHPIRFIRRPRSGSRII